MIWRSVQLSDLEGKGVMLNFWGTWCKPCEAEMPYMETLYPEYNDKGIEIVAVSLDSTELVINRFIDKHDLTFPVFLTIQLVKLEIYIKLDQFQVHFLLVQMAKLKKL